MSQHCTLARVLHALGCSGRSCCSDADDNAGSVRRGPGARGRQTRAKLKALPPVLNRPTRLSALKNHTQKEKKTMKAQVRIVSLVGVAVIAALAITVQLFAQDNASQQHKTRHQRYRLHDVGTFGGPDAALWNGQPFGKTLSRQGITVGAASTTTPDPFYPNCAFGDCLVAHPFQYRDGHLTDLGTLGASTNTSLAHGSNDRGWIVGVGENGAIDPLTGFPEIRAVLWKTARSTIWVPLVEASAMGSISTTGGRSSGERRIPSLIRMLSA